MIEYLTDRILKSEFEEFLISDFGKSTHHLNSKVISIDIKILILDSTSLIITFQNTNTYYSQNLSIDKNFQITGTTSPGLIPNLQASVDLFIKRKSRGDKLNSILP